MNRSTERLFERLLSLLPVSFRDRFGVEMREVLRADHEASRSRGDWGRVSFWWRTLSSVLVAAPREHFADMLADLRYSWRSLRKSPIFALTAILSLAIGIGATTTVLAIFDATFGRGIPGASEMDRLVNVKLRSDHEETFQLTSYPTYRDLRDSGVLQDVASFSGMRMSFSLPLPELGGTSPRSELGGTSIPPELGGTSSGRTSSEPELLGVQLVTDNYFAVFGVGPRLGRIFQPGDETRGEQIAVVSSWLWRQRLGADPQVVGRDVRLNGEMFTIVGVAGEGFRGNFIGFPFDVFVTTAMTRVADLPSREERSARWLELVGRLPDGGSLERVRSGFALQAHRLEDAWPDVHRGLEIDVERCDGHDTDLRGGLASFLAILSAVAGFVLLIACANVANLMLARLLRRKREMSVRMALGAPRSRLARQLLTEAALLALLAGGLGALIAMGSTAFASQTIPAFGGVVLDVRIDGRVLVAAFVVSSFSAILFGLVPAIRAAKTAPSFARGSSESGRSRLRSGLVVGQVALSVILLTTAGLFLHALRRASSLDPGFEPQGVIAVRLDPALAGIDADRTGALFASILQEAGTLPGVQSASLAGSVPLSLGARFFPRTKTVAIPGHEPPPGRDGFAIEHAVISAGYLETLRIPIVAGRDFNRQDRADTLGVALVNQTFVKQFLASGGDPGGGLGRTLRIEDRELAIVGVVRDSRYRTLDEEELAFLYLPFEQFPVPRVSLLVRGPDSSGLARQLRALVRRQAPELPLGGLGSLADVLAVSLLPQRIAGTTASLLGLVGLLLTAIGLYGVLAYTVRQRSAEIGVRMSLGAAPRHVLRLVLRFGLGLTAAGLVLGFPLAALGARALSPFLYGVSPWSPLTYAAIAALLILTAALAAYAPARRATKIDPLRVLRAD